VKQFSEWFFIHETKWKCTFDLVIRLHKLNGAKTFAQCNLLELSAEKPQEMRSTICWSFLQKNRRKCHSNLLILVFNFKLYNTFLKDNVHSAVG